MPIVSIIANHTVNDRTIFLFNECLVILVLGTTTGEGDVIVTAVSNHLVIYKFTATICVKTQQRKWNQYSGDIVPGDHIITILLQ